MLTRNGRFQKRDLVRRKFEQPIDDDVDVALGLFDFGAQFAHLRGALGEIAFPLAALLDRNIGVEHALDLVAERVEVERPPFNELA